MEYVQGEFVRKNYTKMILAAMEDVKTQVTEELEEKHANPDKTTDSQRPAGSSEDAEKEKFFDKVRSGEQGPGVNKPLFGGK